MINLTITASDHCRRVDSLLHNLLPAAPLSYRRKLVIAGHVRVNGHLAVPGTILRMADVVSLKESSRTATFLEAARPPLDLLYEDGWIMAFNKPPGLPMHPAAEVEGTTMVEWGSAFYAGQGGEGKLRPVNRLDRGTSGVVILAKSASGAGMFGRFVKEEGLGKLYLAVVDGIVAPEGVISEPLMGKEAETRYRVLCQGNDAALLALCPLTGRMHQLRQHLRIIGHPVRGDRRYGGSEVAGYPGHALHSFKTTFRHPATDEQLTIGAPLPPGFLLLAEEVAGPAFPRVFASLADL
jgi:23S rRNA pseudouridine955/2504/2580 synthase